MIRKLLSLSFLFFSLQSFSQTAMINTDYQMSVCKGATLKFKYTVSGTFAANNVFTAQLSDANGSFSSPVIVGSIVSNQSDSILLTFPSTANGSYYLVRLVSSAPALIHSYSNSMRIGTPPSLYASVYAENPLCTGNTLHLTTNYNNGEPLLWTGPNGFSSTIASPVISNVTTAMSGTYKLSVQWRGGCTGPGTSVVVNVDAQIAPPKPIVSGNTPICAYDTLKLMASNVTGATGYAWFDPQGNLLSQSQNFSIVRYSSSLSGRYTFRSGKNSCRSDSASYQVIINPKPDITSTSVNNDIDLTCKGSDILLQLNTYSNATYTWNGPGGFTGTGTSLYHNNVTASGVYTIEGITDQGCRSSATTSYLGVYDGYPTGREGLKWRWANGLSSMNSVSTYTTILDIKSDTLGYVYLGIVANSLSKAIYFTPNDSLKTDENDIIVAKYDTAGTFKWARKMGGMQNDNYNDMDVNGRGDVFISGMFTTAIQVGSYTLPNKSTGANYFVAMLDTDGNYQWVKQGIDSVVNGGSPYSSLTADSKGNCIFARQTYGKFYMDGLSVPYGSYTGKIAPTGQLKWLKSTQIGNQEYFITNINADANGNLFGTGNSGFYPFIMKMDSSGNVVFTQKYMYLRPGGNLNRNFVFWSTSCKAGKDGSLYSYFSMLNTFKNASDAYSTLDHFHVLLKTDANGNEIWHQYINEGTSALAIALDEKDNIFVTGKMQQKINCTDIVINSGNSNSFISKYNTDGQWLWVKPINGITGPNININRDGSIYYSATNTISQTFATTYIPVSNYLGNIAMFGKFGSRDSIPDVSFTYKAACYPDPVTFTNTTQLAVGDIASTSWDFGDPSSGAANTSNSSNGSHWFSASGNYTVSLTVVSSFNKQWTVTRTVDVLLKPNINFSFDGLLCQNSMVNFNATTDLNPVAYTWDFDDPASGALNAATVANTQHRFTQTGDYLVTLIGDKEGCRDTTIQKMGIFNTQTPVITLHNDTLETGTYHHYYWTKDGASIGGDTPYLKLHSDGDYAVNVEDINGCSASSIPFHYILTALEEQQNTSLRIYPNPSRGIVTIEYSADNTSMLTWEITDVWGNRLVQENRLMDGRNNIFNQDLSSLPSGLYYLSLIHANQKSVSKLVVEH